jgi:glucan 1,3-beta-glucosidase
LLAGWAVADIPTQSASPLDWIGAAVVIALAFAIPPVAAASIVRRTPLGAFAAVLDQAERRALPALQRAMTILFLLLVVISIQLALGLVFDPKARDIPFAPLTGPAAALAVLAFGSGTARGPGSIAEAGAAIVLAASAAYIVFNETFWNWQALWFAAVLLMVAAVCWRTAGARTR